MAEKEEELSETQKMFKWYLHQKDSWNGVFERLRKIDEQIQDFTFHDNYDTVDISCCVNCEFKRADIKQSGYRSHTLEGFYCYHRHTKVSPLGICRRYLKEGPEDE